MIEGIDQRLVGALTLEKSVQELNAISAQIENGRQTGLRLLLTNAFRNRVAQRRAIPQQFPAFMESSSLMTDREFSMKSLMREITQPIPLKVEDWVQSLASDEIESFGLVIYKNTYKPTNPEWDMFLAQLDEGLNSGWEGVLDPENAKRKANLHWIDGEKESIPEDDIAAVRRYNYISSE